ncbi:hypothetical protein AB0F96_05700 [Streptomyces sp. NPDC023998]|uniref:hypothetical protein n=1 Tax=Streptomyces sp. NPDC023998 TaxID=3154597 RepID=UPI0033F5EEC1
MGMGPATHVQQLWRVVRGDAEQVVDDIYKHGGFAVHFFDRPLVDTLADGWHLAEVHAVEEGGLPRRLGRITQNLLT